MKWGSFAHLVEEAHDEVGGRVLLACRFHHVHDMHLHRIRDVVDPVLRRRMEMQLLGLVVTPVEREGLGASVPGARLSCS